MRAAALARIWADAPPLAQAIEDRALKICSDATSARTAPPIEQLSNAERVVLYAQHQMNMMGARERAKTAIGNDLIAGRSIGIGRRRDAQVFEPIDKAFWIGAALNWDHDGATRGDCAFIEIRMVSPDALSFLQPEATEGVGRPSRADAIRAAIDHYAKTDPSLSRPPSERTRAYFAYLTKLGHDPRNQKGFEPKTIQKYEREYRRKVR